MDWVVFGFGIALFGDESKLGSIPIILLWGPCGP